MKPIAKRLVFWGALAAGSGVALGAFGAHGLRGAVSSDMLGVYETGVRYQMYHALGLIAAGFGCALAPDRRSKRFTLAGLFFGIGVLLFSGSLYALVLTNSAWLGGITPLGGLSLIIGWVVFASAFWGME
jgi:uncharacterized membrane protein YgdD (TMEM256/DUF423 family)